MPAWGKRIVSVGAFFTILPPPGMCALAVQASGAAMKNESGIPEIKQLGTEKSPTDDVVADVRWLVGQMKGARDAEPPRGLVDATMRRVQSIGAVEPTGQGVAEGLWR